MFMSVYVVIYLIYYDILGYASITYFELVYIRLYAYIHVYTNFKTI